MIQLGPSKLQFAGTYTGAARYVDGAGIGLPCVPDCAGFDDGWHVYIPEQPNISVTNGGWAYKWPRGYFSGYLLDGTIETTEACYGDEDFSLLVHLNYGADDIDNSTYFGAIPYIKFGGNYYGNGWCRWKQSNGQIGYCIPKLRGSSIPKYKHPDTWIEYTMEEYLSPTMPLPNPQTTVYTWFEIKRESGNIYFRSYDLYANRDATSWNLIEGVVGTLAGTLDPVTIGLMRIGNFPAGLTKGCAKFDLIASTYTRDAAGYWISDQLDTAKVIDAVNIHRDADTSGNWPDVKWSSDAENWSSTLPYLNQHSYMKVTTDNPPTKTKVITENGTDYTFEYLSSDYIEQIDVTYTSPSWEETLIPETWTLAECRACMRRRLRYDGDSELMTDANLDSYALEAQRMIIEQLRWPILEQKVTAGALTDFTGTILSITYNGNTYEPPIYPVKIDLSDIKNDIIISYLPEPTYLCLPQPLYEAICALSTALALSEVDSPRREAAYRSFAADRILNFKRQLNTNAIEQNELQRDLYGISL